MDKLRKLYNLIYETIFLFITNLFPRNKRLLLFGAWWGKRYDDNSRFLFEYTYKNRKDVKSVWLTPEREVCHQLIQKGLPVCYSFSIRAYWYAFRAKYMVVSTSFSDIGSNLRPFTGGITEIMLWHGVPLKKIMYDDKHSQERNEHFNFIQRIVTEIERYSRRKFKSEFVFCTSDFYVPIFHRAFRVAEERVLNLGYARNDYFYTDHNNSIKERFAGKKIILYMPTHRREGLVEQDMHKLLDLKLINDICKQHDAIFLIKKHFYHTNDPIVENEEYSNIVEITYEKPQAQVLLDAGDILVSDYSGSFIDYLLLDRPMIFYAYDLQDYLANDREMYVDYIPNAPGKICSSSQDLCDEIVNLLNGNDDYVEKRHEQRDFYYSPQNQGIVSPKQLKTILSL